LSLASHGRPGRGKNPLIKMAAAVKRREEKKMAKVKMAYEEANKLAWEIIPQRNRYYQREAVRNLLTGGCFDPRYTLRGKAKNYAGRYVWSFESVRAKMRELGYKIGCELGPRGGQWSAVYWLEQKA
jgi:hypothetical protein